MFFSDKNPWFWGALLFVVRYFLLAGLTYFVFYVWKRKEFSRFKIQSKSIEKNQLRTELLYTFSTFLIYSATAGITLYFFKMGWTHIYLDFHQYGLLYFVFSIFVMILIHDAYFYWTHKLLHRYQWLYQFHKIHHFSQTPTPWSAFSFHPVEAFISLGFIPLLLFLLPIHPMALLIFLTVMTIYNIFVHLGFEVVSAKSSNHPIGKWQNTTTNHDLHHQCGGQFNYGFYFSFWDKQMGTFKEKIT